MTPLSGTPLPPTAVAHRGPARARLDLGQATGARTDLPDDLVEQALAFVRAELPSQPRAGRFDDPRPISNDASVIDQLAAFTGRPVPWTPPAS
jgi:hypothetical protein